MTAVLVFIFVYLALLASQIERHFESIERLLEAVESGIRALRPEAYGERMEQEREQEAEELAAIRRYGEVSK